MSAARQTLCMAHWLSMKPAAAVDKPIGDDRSVQSKQFQVLCAKLVAALHPWNTLYISSANAQAAFQMTSKAPFAASLVIANVS